MAHMVPVSAPDVSTGIDGLRELLLLLREHGCLEYEGPVGAVTCKVRLLPLMAQREPVAKDEPKGEKFAGKSRAEMDLVLGPLRRGA